MNTPMSASDRLEAARRALATYESRHKRGPGFSLGLTDSDHPERNWSAKDSIEMLAEALRALIQPPPVDNHPDDLADAWATRLYERGTIEVLGMNSAIFPAAYREAYLQGIRAGIQAAWETWEPEAAPTIDDNTDLIEDLRQIRDQRGDWRGVLDSLIGDDE